MKSMSSAHQKQTHAQTASLLADAWAHIVMFLQRRVASLRARRQIYTATSVSSSFRRLCVLRSGKRELRARCGRDEQRLVGVVKMQYT